MRRVIFSCKGRLIGPREGSFPSMYEILYGLMNTNRFRGQGAFNGNKYNVLKHSVLVAFYGCLLNGPRGFAKYILHEFEEVFGGDRAATFKTPADKELELTCMEALRRRLFPNNGSLKVTQAKGVWENTDITVPDMFLRDIEYRILFPWNRTYYDEFVKFEYESDIPLPKEFQTDLGVQIARELIRKDSEKLMVDLLQILPYTLAMKDTTGPIISKFFMKYLKRSL